MFKWGVPWLAIFSAIIIILGTFTVNLINQDNLEASVSPPKANSRIYINTDTATLASSEFNPCIADSMGDGDVDGFDLAIFVNSHKDNCLAGTLCDGDFDDDGDIDNTDLMVFATGFGKLDCPDSVPVDIDLGVLGNEQRGGGGLIADAVRIINGNAIEARDDINFPSPYSKGFIFSAVYNSRSGSIGNTGFGWYHTYSITLELDFSILGQPYLKVIDETGRPAYFIEDGTGFFRGAFNEKTHITAISDYFIWHRLDGTSYRFAANGRLLWIEDEKGNRLDLQYDNGGLLELVLDVSSGRTLSFNYNADSLIESISGPVTESVIDGIWVRFIYDENNNLYQVNYPDGSGYDYAYTDVNDAHNLTTIHNRAGHLVKSWEYDDQDRCTNYFNPDGKGVAIAYINDSLIDVTDVYGTVRSYTLGNIEGRKRIAGMAGTPLPPYSRDNIVRWVYDGQLNLTEIEYGGGAVTQFSNYDLQGNPVEIIYAAGTPVVRKVQYTYHPEMNTQLARFEASVLGGGNKETIWDYDDDSNSVPNEFPTRLVYRIIERGNTYNQSGTITPYEYITHLSYNDRGQVVSIDGPKPGYGDTKALIYDGSTGNLSSISHPLIGSTTFSNYDGVGRVTSIIDVNGQIEFFNYDARGRQTTVTHGADNSTNSVVYNTAGLPFYIKDEDGVSREFDYDSVYGRLSHKYDMDDNFISYSYNHQGNLIEKAKHDASGIRFSLKQWNYQHPIYPGRLWKSINSDDSYVEYAYDDAGNIISVKNPNNHTTFYDYDELDRITAIDYPDSTSIGYGYDSHGNVTSFTDGIGNKTTLIYDDMGRLVKNTSPDTGVTSYAYDESGNILQQTDAKGITVQYAYDDLNRLINVHYPDPSQNVTYLYDIGPNSIGRLSTITDESGSTLYEYSNRGRLVGKDSTIEGVNYSLSRSFSLGGRLLEMIYPSGRRVDVTHNSNGRKQSVSTALAGNTVVLVSNLDYLPFGRPRSFETGSGGSVTTVSGDCECLETSNPGTPFEHIYSYDANRNLTSINGTSSPWYNQDFTYDSRNRLVGAEGPYGSYSYTYDGAGNRLNRTVNSKVETYNYSPGSNRLDSVVTEEYTISFGYDANGNMNSIGNRNLYYNQNNRLIRVEEDSTIKGEYVYNALGQRVSKNIEESVNIYLYDFDGNIISEGSSDGTINWDTIYLGESRSTMVENSSETFYYFLNDHLGTPQMATDSSNTIVWETSYKPFGETVVNPKSTVSNNFRFPGQYHDQETGLHYNYHRYYDPKIGRYLRPDPIGLVGGLNLYVYAENNPVNAYDAHGLEAFILLDEEVWWKTTNRSPHQPLPGYNYCGPGNIEKEPTNSLDVACKIHDECYKNCGIDSRKVKINRPGQDRGPSCQDDCDDALCLAAIEHRGWIRLGVQYLFCD